MKIGNFMPSSSCYRIVPNRAVPRQVSSVEDELDLARPLKRKATRTAGYSSDLEIMVRASPIFVVGCPRSGTTLVQTILDSHPDLCVIYEADFLVDVPLELDRCPATADRALASAEYHPNFRNRSADFDATVALEKCRELGITNAVQAMRLVAARYAQQQGKRRWGNKTPKALIYIFELSMIYPDAQFIHVIRDGRESVASQARVSNRNIFQGALLWRTGIRRGLRARSELAPGRYLEVRLEDLLYSPASQILRMCRFLGEKFDESMLISSTAARARIPSSDLQLHPRLGQPLHPVSSDIDFGSDIIQRAATALIEPELAELGYIEHRGSLMLRPLYLLIGYLLFSLSLRKNWRDLLRHLARVRAGRRFSK